MSKMSLGSERVDSLARYNNSSGNRINSANPRSERSKSLHSKISSYDDVLVEDLDINLNSDTTFPTTATTSAQSLDCASEEFYTQLNEDILVRRDFQVFQSSNFSALIEGTVSASDFYVLVKRRTSFSIIDQVEQSYSFSHDNPVSSFCLGVSSSNKIYTIGENEDSESEDYSVSNTKRLQPIQSSPDSSIKPEPRNCWLEDDIRTDEFEETHIQNFNPITPFLLPNQVPNEIDYGVKVNNDQHHEVPLEAYRKYKENISSPSAYNDKIQHSTPGAATVSVDAFTQILIEEIDLHSDYLLRYREVSLENHGILITPTRAAAANKLLVFEAAHSTGTQPVKFKQNECCFKRIIKLLFRKCGLQFKCCSTSNSKLHANIYKTYFVKWDKPPLEDASISKQTAFANKLRRSHSAIF